MKINFKGQNFAHLCHFYFRSDLCMLSTKGGRDHLCFLSLGVLSEGTGQGRVWKDTEPGHMALCGHGTLLFLEGCSDTQRPEVQRSGDIGGKRWKGGRCVLVEVDRIAYVYPCIPMDIGDS